MFVDEDDFNVIPYNIPVEQLADTTFDAFVDAEEEELLRKLLGNALYIDFVEALLEDYPAQKWIDLRDGADYVVDGVTYRWKGMKALFKPYINSKWVYHHEQTQQSIGMTKAKSENSDVVESRDKVSMDYSEFSRVAGLYKKKTNSLYGFLSANWIEDYSNWLWTEPGSINRFDL